MTYILVKFQVIQKHSAFSVFTWYLLFVVVDIYKLTFNQNLAQWAELWLILGCFYFVVYELKINLPEKT